MAMAWIREIRNCDPASSLRVRVDDGGRHPSLNGRTFNRDEWIAIPRPVSAQAPASIHPENMAVPWGFGGAQRLIIEVEVNGATRTVSAEISGDSGWDYLVLRDGELREIGRTEIGSLGDAPGVNHSWWAVVLHSNGKLEWHLFERQGMHRDDLVNIANQTGKFFIDLIPEVIKVVGDIAPLVAAAV